jgi:Coenzyme PQQ synthesis protein D (PqqD)
MRGQGGSVRIRKDVVFRDLDGELVLLNLRTGVYFGLDRVGTRIWGLIADERSLGEIVGELTAEYEVDAGTCEADVAQFVATLADNDLVDLADAPPR